MHSVAQVLNPGFGRSWHECVAIVQEAASQMQPGLALPGPEDLLLGEDGTLSFGFGSESSDHPVSSLADLLLRLLDGVEAPGGLTEIAAENATASPSHPTVESFSRALAFYERPNRVNDLRAVAGRLRGYREKSTTDQEFARLREKVAGSPEPDRADAEPEPKPGPPLRFTRRQRQVIVAGVTAGLVIGFATVQLRNSSGVSFGGLFAGVDQGMTDLVSGGLNLLGFSIPASAAPSTDVPVEEPGREETGTSAAAAPPPAAVAAAPIEASRRRSGARVDRASDRSDAGPAAVPAGRGSSPPRKPVASGTSGASPAVAPPVPALPAMPVPRAFEPSASVYSPEDAEVAPPALMRPQMPREPKPGDDTGYFDLLVDETGTVEQVKLISPTRRYHDRMLVAAAKAWRFRPAMLDGHPVKYRVRIPIILPGMP